MARYTFTFLVLVLFSSLTFAQQATLKGIVNDASANEPLIGASVRISGTTLGAMTDIDGNYELVTEPGTITIIVSFIGFDSVSQVITLKAGETKIIDFNLGEEPMLIDEVVVTASKYEKKLGEETVSISVIKPATLAKENLTSVDQAISRAPGVTIIDGQANIRGGSGYSYGAGSRVLILMDDLPILDAAAGFMSWSSFPIESVGQIEIIKGAASALYGSSAMNGIINLRTTYATDKPQTKVSFSSTIFNAPNEKEYNSATGEYDQVNKEWWKLDSLTIGDTTIVNDQNQRPHELAYNFNHKQRFGKYDMVLGGNVRTRSDFRYGSFENSVRVNSFNRYWVNEKINVGLNVNFQKANSGTFFLWQGGGISKYLPGITGIPTRSKTLRLTLDPYFSFGDSKGNRHKILGRYYNTDNDNGNNQGNYSDNLYGEYQYQRFINKIDMVITGGAVGSFTIIKAELYGDTTYTGQNFAGYAQVDQKLWEKLNLTLGFRLENYKLTNTKAETKPVFRFGVNYQAAKYSYIRASFGQGFRFPTVAEKYIETSLGSGLSISSNPGLTPESGYSAELGFKQGVRIGGLNALLDVSGFYMEYQDMIEFNVSPTGEPGQITFNAQNVGDTRIYGTEITLAGEGKLAHKFPMNLLLGYTYIKPEFKNWEDPIESTGQSPAETSITEYNVLKYRFRHTFTGSWDINFKGLEIGFSGQFFSFMENGDLALFNDVVTPGVIDFRESRLKKDWESKKPQHQHKGDFIVDARIGYYFGKNDQAKISFLMKNIGNREYTLRPALVEAPRSYAARLDFNF